MEDLDIVEERDGYRVRLEFDDSPEQPYDDGATPILTIERGSHVEAFNKQAEPYVGTVAELLQRFELDTVERFVKIFYGATKMDSFYSDGIRGTYIAFDTAEWREAVGAAPERLQAEDYLSEVRAWAEGEVYGHVVEKFDADADEWEATDDGTCWGFYGREWAEQAAREALTAEIDWAAAHPAPVPVVVNPWDAAREHPGIYADWQDEASNGETLGSFSDYLADVIAARLEELRDALDSESISYGELAELQSLAKYIEPGDVQLLEAAGVPEFED